MQVCRRTLLLGIFLLVFSCRGGIQHASEFLERVELTPHFSPERNEEAARGVAGNFVARHFLPLDDSLGNRTHRIDGICLDRIRWDSAFSFGQWEGIRWMDLPGYQDVHFESGPRLRIVFNEPIWVAFPVYGDSSDMAWECKACLDSTRVELARRNCR